jgi:hypothetical protein
MAEEAHMGGGTEWISRAFKVLEALIGLRRSPQPDRSGARPSQDAPPEALAVSPPDSSLRPEPATETDALPAQSEAGLETPPAQEVETLPVQEDDEGRRKLIRQLFNEYWTGLDDKPPTFAKRLEIAEAYINERLADRDVGWRLDAVTRKQLGLPSSQ